MAYPGPDTRCPAPGRRGAKLRGKPKRRDELRRSDPQCARTSCSSLPGRLLTGGGLGRVSADQRRQAARVSSRRTATHLLTNCHMVGE